MEYEAGQQSAQEGLERELMHRPLYRTGMRSDRKDSRLLSRSVLDAPWSGKQPVPFRSTFCDS